MTVTATSFWQQAALNAIGPLITAVFGLLIAGLAVNFLTRAAQNRRTAIQLKYKLISEITATASTLYHNIIQYHRALTGADPARDKAAAEEECERIRKKLLGQYPATRAQAEVLQARLTAYFEEPRVAVAWHAVRDCLTVRYYYEVSGKEAPYWNNIRDENCKGSDRRFHTGLPAEDLNDPDNVNNAYKSHLKTTAQLIFVCPLRPRRYSRRAKRATDRALEDTKEKFDYREPADRKVLVPSELRNNPDHSPTNP